MLSLQLIRENPDIVRKALHDRQADGGLDEILRLDQEYRQLLTEWEELKAQRNVLGKQVGSARDAGARQGLIDSTRELSTQIDRLGPDIVFLSKDLKRLLLELPNIPSDDTPVGAGEEQDVVVRSEGELPAFDFEPRPHWEIGERLRIIDFERGVKLSGSRFYVLSGAGALLQRALIA